VKVVLECFVTVDDDRALVVFGDFCGEVGHGDGIGWVLMEVFTGAVSDGTLYQIVEYGRLTIRMNVE
jgi:hypothetical protein